MLYPLAGKLTHVGGGCDPRVTSGVREGEAMINGPKPKPLADRIRSSTVIDANECWVWQKSLKDGYGRMWIGSRADGSRRLALAYQVSFETFSGPIPDGLVLDHLCRNRACCNPAHLEPVTQQENVLRGIGPSAANAQKTHCFRGHEFTLANTYMSKGKRFCGECIALRSSARRDTPEFKAREAERVRHNYGHRFRSPATLVATRSNGASAPR